jgi:hypothetical protein
MGRTAFILMPFRNKKGRSCERPFREMGDTIKP